MKTDHFNGTGSHFCARTGVLGRDDFSRDDSSEFDARIKIKFPFKSKVLPGPSFTKLFYNMSYLML